MTLFWWWGGFESYPIPMGSLGCTPQGRQENNFFPILLEKASLVDIEPVKLSPTWKNFRIGDEEVAKILDRFLVSEAPLDLGSFFREVVEVGGILDHRPIGSCCN